jgi:hypothetical protein
MRFAVSWMALLVGCGGSVSQEPLTVFDDAGKPIDAGTLDAAVDASKRDSSVDAGRDGGRDAALDTWVDPGCPDAPAPPKDFRCDPLAPPPGDCPKGQACFPFVEYPTDPCDPEIYRAACFPAGSGKAGDPCSGGDCAAGFVCVATGAGNVCVSVCNPAKSGGCPEGLVCSPTDVPGVGGCL